MTVEEVFTTIAQHMEKGLAMHRDFVKAYNFYVLKDIKNVSIIIFLKKLKTITIYVIIIWTIIIK